MARGAGAGREDGPGRQTQRAQTKGAKGALKGGEHFFVLLFWTFWDFVVYLERGLEPASFLITRL